MVNEKSAEKSSVRQKEEESAKNQLYQCYIDLSQLVFPESKPASKSILINNHIETQEYFLLFYFKLN